MKPDLRMYYRKADGTQGVSHNYTPKELADMEPVVDEDPRTNEHEPEAE